MATKERRPSHGHHAVTADNITEENSVVNRAAAGISYFTPAQDPPAGTAFDPQEDEKPIPKLFQPLKIRGMTMQNRTMVSPLCQYSAPDGHYTMWHLTHLGGMIQRGPGITCVEATAVTPEGRITPEDVGLWKDSQMEGLRQLVEFAHSQSQKVMIQLGHAGRKASTVAPWLSSGETAGEELNGWPNNVLAPSAIAYNDKFPKPKAMTLEQIQEFKTAYANAVKRALQCGFDAIEIHSAHGYLLHSFLSPVSNQRTDEYGGDWEGRTRLVREVAKLTRSLIPDSMPLFLRISASDWLEESRPDTPSWRLEDSVRLAEALVDLGVDVIDVSSGGLHPDQHIHSGPGYQTHFSKAIKDKVGDNMLVASVGMITEGKQAEEILQKGEADIVVAGRAFQKNPGLVWAWAEDLGVEINLANQIRWGFGGRGKKTQTTKKKE